MSYYYFLLLLPSIIWSQQVVVQDATTGSPLPYAIVRSRDQGVYTDDRGVFDLGTILSDTVTVSFLGYKDAIIHKEHFDSAIIALKKEPLMLDEITIGSRRKLMTLKPPKRPRDFSSFPLSAGNEILIWVKPEKSSAFLIKAVKVPISKSILPYLRKKKATAVVRLNFYTSDDRVLYRSAPIELLTHNKGEIVLDLNEQNLHFHSSGIKIGLEIIGIKGSTLDEDPFTIHPELTHRDYPDFQMETYVRFLKGPGSLKRIEEIFEHSDITVKNIRNLRMYLELETF